MDKIIERDAQIENEDSILHSQLERYGIAQDSEKELLKALENMPDGTMYRTVRDMQTKELRFEYVSGTWEKIMGVSVEETLADPMNVFRNLYPGDLQKLMQRIEESLNPLTNFSIEARYVHPINKQEYWMNLSSYPSLENERIYANGFIFDISARKNAEQKLLIEKERLESLGNNIPDTTLFQFYLASPTDPFRLKYVSAKWESITGIPAHVAMSSIDILFAIINPEDLPKVKKNIVDSSATMESFSVDFRISVRAETRWVEMAAKPIKDGNTIIWDGLITDITQRKKAENDLQNEKNRLQMFGDNLPGSTLYQFIRDNRTGQMRLSYVSGTWESVTGVPAEAAKADMSKLLDTIEENDLDELMKSIEDSSRTMTDHFFETKFGEQWVQIVARPRKEGAYTIWDGIMTNITTHKKIEQELNTEKNKLQSIGDNLPAGSLFQFVKDTRTKQMRLSYVSNSWEAVTGVAVGDSLADITKVFSLMPPEEFPIVLKKIEESATNFTDFSIEISLGDRWVKIISRPRKETSTLIVWDGIIINITESKKIEEELAQYREKLENIVEQRTEELIHANNELNVIVEELNSANEELNTINDELNKKNDLLEHEVELRMIVVKKLEEKQIELSAALQENRYQLLQLDLLVEASSTGLWDMEVVKGDPINPNNKFMWSDSFRKLLGYSSEDEFPNVLSSWSDKLHPEDKEISLKAFADHLLDKSGKTPYNIEYKLQKKDGTYAKFHAFGATIRHKDGTALRVAGAIKEI